MTNTQRRTNGVVKTIVREVIREEIKTLEHKFNDGLGNMEGRFDSKLTDMEGRFDSKLTDMEERIDEKIDNSFRKYKDEVLTGLDKVMGELKSLREESSAHQLHHGRINERVDVLESIHPGSRHV